MAKFDPNPVPGAEYPSGDGYAIGASSFDFREIYAAVYRARYILVAIMVACLMLGVAVTLLMTRKYEGKASIEVRQEAEKVLGTEADRENASSRIDIERFLDTQIDLIQSRSVAMAVANQLNLFNQQYLEDMHVSKRPEADGVLTEKEALRELVLKTLGENLDVGYTGQTRVLVIKFTSPDARLSARIANAYAESYIQSNLERKSESSTYALRFLRKQLLDAQARLEASERASLEYARRTRIVDASNAAKSTGAGQDGQPQSLITAQLVQLNEAYSTAVASRVAAEQKWRRTARMSAMNIPEVLNNQAVQALLEQRSTVEAQYKEQLETRQAEYPTVRQAAAKLREVDRQLGLLAQNIRAGIESQYQVARSQEMQLQTQIDKLKGLTLVEQNQSIQLSILRREADTNRAQYEALLRRYNQLNAESGVQANNLVVVDKAVALSKPSVPNIPLNLALAAVVGLFACIAYIFGATRLFDRIRTTIDVSERLGLPILGAIPASTDVLEEIADQKSMISESLNLVRTGLTLSSQGGAPKTAMITSTQASEGKSSTCLALGISFSRLGKKVLIIDVDLRRPNIHRLLNLSNRRGASEVLAGQGAIESVIQATDFAGLDVITSGPIPPNPTDLIMSAQLELVLEQLATRYDLILLDSPPMLALADAEIISSKVQATMFVIESGRNNRKAVLQAVRRIQGGGAKLRGVILTKYDPGQQGYGYSSEYAYGYQYNSSSDA